MTPRPRHAGARPHLHPSLRAWPAFAILEAARLVRAALDAAFEERDGPAWRDLIILTVLDEYRHGISQSGLGDRTGIDRTTLGRLLADLEDECLVRSTPSVTDRRRIIVAPTAPGRRALAEGRDVVAEAERLALRRLKAAERRRLAELSRRALPQRAHPLAALLR